MREDWKEKIKEYDKEVSNADSNRRRAEERYRTLIAEKRHQSYDTYTKLVGIKIVKKWKLTGHADGGGTVIGQSVNSLSSDPNLKREIRIWRDALKDLRRF